MFHPIHDGLFTLTSNLSLHLRPHNVDLSAFQLSRRLTAHVLAKITNTSDVVPRLINKIYLSGFSYPISHADLAFELRRFPDENRKPEPSSTRDDCAMVVQFAAAKQPIKSALDLTSPSSLCRFYPSCGACAVWSVMYPARVSRVFIIVLNVGFWVRIDERGRIIYLLPDASHTNEVQVILRQCGQHHSGNSLLPGKLFLNRDVAILRTTTRMLSPD